MSPKTVRVLLAGYGTVGRTLHEILTTHADRLRDAHGLDLRVTAIARRDRVAADPAGLAWGDASKIPWKTGTLFDLLGENNVDVLVEATPTNLQNGQPALGHTRAALHAGLPVVLANKGPVVVAYKELQERADKAGVPLRFEATVAGCVPTLNAARVGFAGDQIQRVEGILNGTTNFILTRMSEEGSDFDQALKEAQALGYAETDPTADVDGLDAAAKVVILGNALLGLDLTMDKVDRQGIRGVTRQAVEVANANGFRLKLIAEADRSGAARVGLRLVRRGSTLDVHGVLNAVRFTNEFSGPVTHIGRGAGGRPTAAALLSDLIGIFGEHATARPRIAHEETP